MTNGHNNLYEFGKFRMDTSERVLLCENETIMLAPKVFDTLEILVKRNGKTVTKDELMDEIWADSFVDESNLTQNIYTLRQALGKEFIETMPRRGYRFAADVKTVSIAEKAESFNGINGTGDVLIAQKTRTQIVEEEFVENPISDKLLLEETNTKPAKPNKFYMGIAVASVAFLITSLFGYWIWTKSNAETVDTGFEETQIRNLTNSGDVTSLSISPNGKLIAYTKVNNENESTLYLKDLILDKDVKVEISRDILPNTRAMTGYFMAFSPDGNHIYILSKTLKRSESNIYRITRFGGDPELVVEDATSEFSFSKDGKRIIFVRANLKTNEQSLIIRNLETKEEKVIVKKTFPDGFSLISAPVFSSDESNVYVVIRKRSLHYTHLVSVDVATSKEQIIPTPKWLKIIVQIVKNPIKEELILSGRRNGRLAQIFKLDLDTNKVKPITNDLNNYRKVAISKDGKQLVTLQYTNRSELKLLADGKTNNVQDLTSNSFGKAGRNGLEVMQDGRILYVSVATGNREILLFDTKDNSNRQLTKNTHYPNQNPTTALNGRYIYYVEALKNTRNIKRMDLNGEDQTDLIAEKDSNDILPAVSPNDETLYFIRQKKGVSEIWKKNLPDGTPEKLDITKSAIPNAFLIISPDGNSLAYRQMEKVVIDTENNKGMSTVGVISLQDISAEPKLFKVNANYAAIRWTPTSDAFDFVEVTPAGSTIKRQMIFGKNPPQIVTELPGADIRDFVWMPNSNDLLVSERFVEHDGVLLTNFD